MAASSETPNTICVIYMNVMCIKFSGGIWRERSVHYALANTVFYA